MLKRMEKKIGKIELGKLDIDMKLLKILSKGGEEWKT